MFRATWWRRRLVAPQRLTVQARWEFLVHRRHQNDDDTISWPPNIVVSMVSIGRIRLVTRLPRLRFWFGNAAWCTNTTSVPKKSGAQRNATIVAMVIWRAVTPVNDDVALSIAERGGPGIQTHLLIRRLRAVGPAGHKHCDEGQG